MFGLKQKGEPKQQPVSNAPSPLMVKFHKLSPEDLVRAIERSGQPVTVEAIADLERYLHTAIMQAGYRALEQWKKDSQAYQQYLQNYQDTPGGGPDSLPPVDFEHFCTSWHREQEEHRHYDLYCQICRSEGEEPISFEKWQVHYQYALQKVEA